MEDQGGLFPVEHIQQGGMGKTQVIERCLVIEVLQLAGTEIINDDHPVSLFHQPVDQV